MPEHETTRTEDEVKSGGVTAGFYADLRVHQDTPTDPFFGPFLAALRENLAIGSSELGTAMMLFSLAVATRSHAILEIGRNTGYSTLALAAAAKFNQAGWKECVTNKQRPDIDYKFFEDTPRKAYVWSIDIEPQPVAEELLKKYGLLDYVILVNQDSQTVESEVKFDLMFIDGDHSFTGCLADVERFVNNYLKPGGYFILHDYFGWYVNGKNCSPIMQVCQKCLGDYDQVLIDTGYQSLVLFRKQRIQIPIIGKVDATSPGTLDMLGASGSIVIGE
jgi:hypothetical protein